MEGGSKTSHDAGFADEGRRSQPKGCRWSLEPGKGKETDSSLEYSEKNSPADILRSILKLTP